METASFMSSMNCGDAEQELEALLIRFEEMCRRRKMPIPPKIRPAVYELLAGEMVANASLLGAPPKDIISFTVLRGAASALVDNQEFASFRDTPGIFRRAVMGKPNDPDGFLRGVIQKINELPKREEFASLRDWPGILRQAAISYPSNPEAFLRGVIEKTDELLKQEEFASLRDSPGILRRAAVNYPSAPEAFLRGIIQKIDQLPERKEFASLRDTPGIFKYAAISYSSDPEAFLRRVIQKIDELPKQKEFASLRDTPGIFRRATVDSPSDPEGFLRRIIEKTEKLCKQEEFASFCDSPWVFKRAAMGNPNDPEAFLRGVIQKIEELRKQEEFASIRDSTGILRQAAINYPNDPEAFLRKYMVSHSHGDYHNPSQRAKRTVSLEQSVEGRPKYSDMSPGTEKHPVLGVNQYEKRSRVPCKKEAPNRSQSLETKMLERIQGLGRGSVFIPGDFLDLGSRPRVDFALLCLIKQGILRRLARGLYDYPNSQQQMGAIFPPVEAIAKALAGGDCLRILPSGAYAANLLHLLEQVPAQAVFLTDGPTGKVKVGAVEIVLKRTTPRAMAAAGRMSGLVIQGLKHLGQPQVTMERIAPLRKLLSDQERKQLKHDLPLAPAWMRPFLRALAKGHENA